MPYETKLIERIREQVRPFWDFREDGSPSWIFPPSAEEIEIVMEMVREFETGQGGAA